MSLIGFKMLYADLRSIWYQYPYELETVHEETGYPIVYARGFHFYDTVAAIPHASQYLKAAAGFVIAKVEALGDVVYEDRQIPPTYDTYRVYATNKIRIMAVQSVDLIDELISYYKTDLSLKDFVVSDYVQDIKDNIEVFYPEFCKHFFVRPEDSAFDDASYARKATYPNVIYLNSSDIIDGPDGDDPMYALSIGHVDTLTDEQLAEQIEITGTLLPDWNIPPDPPAPPVIVDNPIIVLTGDGEQILGVEENGVTKYSITEDGSYNIYGGSSTSFTKNAWIEISASTTSLTLIGLFVDNSEMTDNNGVIHFTDTAASTIISSVGQACFRASNADGSAGIQAVGSTDMIFSGDTGVIQVRDTNNNSYGIYTSGIVTINSTLVLDIFTGLDGIYCYHLTCNNGATLMLRSVTRCIHVTDVDMTMDSGSIVNIKEAHDAAIYIPNGSFIMEGGILTMTNIYSDGIRSENADISNGTITISTVYDRAADNLYDETAEVYNTITVNENVTTERVNINYGSHVPLHIGTRTTEYIYTSVDSESSHVAGKLYKTTASGSLKISGGTITLNTLATGISYKDPDASYERRIYGAPSDAIIANNALTITGGTISIEASGSAIRCYGNMDVSKGAKITSYINNRGLSIRTATLGSHIATSTTPYIAFSSFEDTVYVANTSEYYVYDDESKNKYIKITTESSDGSYFATRDSVFSAMIYEGTKSITVENSTDGTDVTIDRTGYGHVINSLGGIYFYSGKSYIYGMNTDQTPIYYAGKLVFGITSYVMIFGVSIEKPNTKNQPYIWEARDFVAGANIEVRDSDDTVMESVDLPKDSAYFIISLDGMSTANRYYVYVDDELVTALAPIL